MQVKKFEAKSMKEALELVKNNLGPDAIILSVRDNGNGYGLVGQGSVEVTAAVAEHTLRKKQFAESKLNEKNKEKFQKSSARSQKDFIDRLVRQHSEIKQQKTVGVRKVTTTPYIQIDNEESAADVAATPGRNVAAMLKDLQSELPASYSPQTVVQPQVARERIQNAVRDAWAAGQTTVASTPRPAANPRLSESNEILALRQEIGRLKSAIQEFHQVPQKFVSVHPGAEQGIPYDLSFMYEKLSIAGISTDNINEILHQAQAEIPGLHIKKRAMVDAWVAKYILNHIQVDEAPFNSPVHLFIGPNGQGKTSSLVKMAGQMVVNQRKRVAILTADSFKVGAAEQLRIYAQILNVPFVVLRSFSDWPAVMKQLGAVDVILMDFPGLQLKDNQDADFIKRLMPPREMVRKTHLVLSCNLKDSDAAEMGRRYEALNFSNVIFTCLDECIQHGVIFNFQKHFGRPLSCFGIGPRIPEDFEEATRERVLDLIFKLSKLKKDVR